MAARVMRPLLIVGVNILVICIILLTMLILGTIYLYKQLSDSIPDSSRQGCMITLHDIADACCHLRVVRHWVQTV